MTNKDIPGTTLSIREDVSLAPLTTFQIGGAAKFFTEVATDDELSVALQWARAHEVHFAILGGGSNILVQDGGYDGLVIKMSGSSYSFAGDQLAADAGCVLLSLIQTSASKNLGGWESLAGIPGTIGGAVRGNAGAFGTEIKDFVETVRAVHSETGEVREFVNAECAFSYRASFFKSHPEWIVTHVFLKLQSIPCEESLARSSATVVERERRHLQNVKAAGSFFMNPVAPKHVQELFETEKGVQTRGGRVPAGWLIEKSGMKGATVGGAQASMQHPNYIVNMRDATSKDVQELATKIKIAVHGQFGVTLQEEAMVL